VVQAVGGAPMGRAAAALALGLILAVAAIATISRGSASELLTKIDTGIPNAKGAASELRSYSQILSFGPGVDPASDPDSSSSDKPVRIMRSTLLLPWRTMHCLRVCWYGMFCTGVWGLGGWGDEE
jgi:hypothetical protein